MRATGSGLAWPLPAVGLLGALLVPSAARAEEPPFKDATEFQVPPPRQEAARYDVEAIGLVGTCRGLQVGRAFRIAHHPSLETEAPGGVEGLALRLQGVFEDGDPGWFSVGWLAELSMAMTFGDSRHGPSEWFLGDTTKCAQVPVTLPSPYDHAVLSFSASQFGPLAGGTVRTTTQDRRFFAEADLCAGAFLTELRLESRRDQYQTAGKGCP
ncbi:MAG: hypothetical protein L0216_10095 [Planctomycetales bacterium]|nr:hypothetical protein [Planctomycetales bacterium]